LALLLLKLLLPPLLGLHVLLVSPSQLRCHY
jgi:hypothetical protein